MHQGSDKKTASKSPISFGEIFCSKRRSLGISRKEASQETRITLSTLSMIEKEDIASFPPEVFMRGFLSSYALMLSIEPYLVIKLYLEKKQVFDQIEARLIRKQEIKEKFISVLVFMAFLAIISSAVVIAVGIGRPVKEKNIDKSVHNNQKSAFVPVAEKKPLLNLEVKAIKNTWIKISRDGALPVKHHLKADQELSLKAKHGFNILAAGPKAIKLSLNNKKISVSGKRGQAVNLVLP